ncbi:MAG: amidase family protein [Nannocystaceae bacterium]
MARSGSRRRAAAWSGSTPSTRGRTPNGPGLTESWSRLTQQHVLCRSMRDTALLLDVESGAEDGATSVVPPPARPFVAELERTPERLRIAVFGGTMLAGTIDPEHAAAVQRAAELCASLGHEVEEAAPELDFAALRARGCWWSRPTSRRRSPTPSGWWVGPQARTSSRSRRWRR